MMKTNPLVSLKKIYARLMNVQNVPANTRPEKAQSLVEFAIVLPILILLLLGVFEVGSALRGYNVLVNVNREAARFAARGVYLNFSEKADPNNVGYDKVISHTLDSLSNQLKLNFNAAAASDDPYSTAMIITYYTINPISSFGCPGDADCSDFDCTRFVDPNHPLGFVAGESLSEIEYPLLLPPPGFELDPNLPPYYGQVLTIANTTAVTSYHFHQGIAAFSRINPAEKLVELRSKNNELNCHLTKKNQPPSNDNLIIIENIYNQPQLAGLPFVTVFVPDPIPFYSHTAMRVTSNVRMLEDEEEAVCELYPIMIPNSKVALIQQQGQSINIEVSNLSEVVPGNFSFVEWGDDPSPDTPELIDNLQNPGNAASNYVEPDSNPQDTQLNIGDWIKSNPGTHNGAKDELTALIGTEMRMPVWIDLCPGAACGGEYDGNNGKFRVFTFVVMKLTAVDLTSSPKNLTFEFSHFDPYACQGDDQP
jgi:hypothetical protein